MFNQSGFSKGLMQVDGTQGETNGLYASVTENDYDSGDTDPAGDSGGDSELTDIANQVIDESRGASPDAPHNGGSGFDIGGWITNINNLGSAIAQTSGNIASDIRVTKANLSKINQPVTLADQFNSMPLIEKVAIGIAAFFVIRVALHKFA